MVSAAHFSFMGTCRNTTFEVLYYNLFSGMHIPQKQSTRSA